MNKSIDKIYRTAKMCGFEAKHRKESENTVFAFKDGDSALNCFFEVVAQNDENEKKFVNNVAHEVFLFSENLDPHTETHKYLKKIGGNLKQYTEIYAQMMALSWKIRNLWLSL